MSELYNRIESLCKREGITITELCRRAGVSRGNLSDLKMGRQSGLSAKNTDKIASYFEVSVGYLLGRTEDPIDYDNDGDALAEIPLSYVEACNGDVRRARAMMLAVDKENLDSKEKTPTPKGERNISDDDIKFALFGTREIDDDVLEQVKAFAKFAKENRKDR